MADLFVDTALLRRAQQDLDRIEPLLRAPTEGMADLAGSATEVARLREALRTFGDEWDYGISKMASYTGGLAEALQTIRDTFDEAERQLSGAFDQ